MSEEHPNTMQPEDALELASAMALRTGLSQDIPRKIMAALQGAEYDEPDPEDLQRANLGRTVLFLSKIESPDISISMTEMVRASQGGGGFAKTAEELSESMGVEVTPEQVEKVSMAWATEMTNGLGTTEEQLTKEFARTLGAAREVAAEHGVAVASVYRSDDLYFEACRKAEPADEMAGSLAKGIENFSQEMINNILVQQLENMMPAEALAQLDPGEITEMAAELQLNPMFQTQIAAYAELCRETMRQTATYFVTRIYGIGTLKELSREHKMAILPRQPLVAEVYDA